MFTEFARYFRFLLSIRKQISCSKTLIKITELPCRRVREISYGLTVPYLPSISNFFASM